MEHVDMFLSRNDVSMLCLAKNEKHTSLVCATYTQSCPQFAKIRRKLIKKLFFLIIYLFINKFYLLFINFPTASCEGSYPCPD